MNPHLETGPFLRAFANFLHEGAQNSFVDNSMQKAILKRVRSSQKHVDFGVR